MKRELGIARCGLACCLCGENEHCGGCNSSRCPDRDWCENRKCAMGRNIGHCFECGMECRKGMLSKIKPYGFTLFAQNTARKRCWTAWNATSGRVWSIIAKASTVIMMTLKMWKR